MTKTTEALQKVGESIKTTITNKSFYLGAILAVGMFSQYIFGPDNLGEQIAEQLYKTTTGKDVDFSPEPETKTEVR
jgi:hypothetical protein